MTPLGAGWPPWLPAGIWPGAVAFSGLLRRARLGCRVCAGLQTGHADDLVSRPDSDGECARAARDNSVGAVVGALERRADGVAANPGSSSGRFWLELCLGREKAGASMFLHFSTIVSTEVSSFLKNSLCKTRGQPKTASAGERPLSSLG